MRWSWPEYLATPRDVVDAALVMMDEDRRAADLARMQRGHGWTR